MCHAETVHEADGLGLFVGGEGEGVELVLLDPPEGAPEAFCVVVGAEDVGEADAGVGEGLGAAQVDLALEFVLFYRSLTYP